MSAHILLSQSHAQRTNAADSGTRLLFERTQITIDHLSETLANFIMEGQLALSSLKWHKQQVKELERKCENMKAHIEDTQSAKRKMEKVLQDLRYSLAPMRTAPTEILIRILEIVVGDEVESTRLCMALGTLVVPSLMPLTLSQVCKRWRETMTGNSSLWKVLYFDATFNSSPPARKRAIDLFRHCASFGLPHQQLLILPRCVLDDLFLFWETTGVPKIPYKRLELVILEDRDIVSGWETRLLSSRDVTLYRRRHIPTIEFMMPLLRAAYSVTIHGTPPRWGSEPWNLLGTLTLKPFSDQHPSGSARYEFTRDDFLQILSAAPSLQRLELWFRIDEATMAWDDRVSASSTSIKYLAVHLHHFIGTKGLFGVQLSLPSLDTLKILSFNCTSPIPVEEEFIYKYLTPKRVILSKMNDTDVTLAGQLLRQLANTTSLEITGEHCNSLLRLAHADYHNFSPPSVPLPIPQVTTLHITDTDIQGDVLIRFVEMKLQHRRARTLGVLCLEEILMYTTPGVTPDHWGRIKAMLDSGRTQNGGGG